MFEQFTEYLTGWQICRLPLSFEGSKLFSFRGASPPAPLDQGLCPGPRWGLRPQTPTTTPHCKPPGLATDSNYGSILREFRDKPIYWSKIVIFFTPPLAFAAPVRWSLSDYFHLVWCAKTMVDYPMVKNFDDIYNRFDTIAVCDRQTDRQADGPMDGRTADIMPQHSPRYAYASRGKNLTNAVLICYFELPWRTVMSDLQYFIDKWCTKWSAVLSEIYRINVKRFNLRSNSTISCIHRISSLTSIDERARIYD